MRKIGNEFGATTGRERRCGWIDLPALKYAIMINGVTELSMMKADVLDSFEDIFVCTHYIQDGDKIDYFPFELSDKTQPVLKKIKGWNTDITKTSNEESFPQELSDYISFLEKELNTPISIVSVGPNRSETIIR